MTLVKRMGAIGSGFALALALGTLPLGAQEPTSPRSSEQPGTAPTKRAYDPSHRVPVFFGQLGLTPEQKESIYKIRGKHQQQIDALEKQLAEIQVQTLAECEALLTDTQKQLLEHRRHARFQGKKGSTPVKTIKESTKSSN